MTGTSDGMQDRVAPAASGGSTEERTGGMETVREFSEHGNDAVEEGQNMGEAAAAVKTQTTEWDAELERYVRQLAPRAHGKRFERNCRVLNNALKELRALLGAATLNVSDLRQLVEVAVSPGLTMPAK